VILPKIIGKPNKNIFSFIFNYSLIKISEWKKRLVKKIKYNLTIEKIEDKRERQENFKD